MAILSVPCSYFYGEIVLSDIFVHIVDDEQSVLRACSFLMGSYGYKHKIWSDPREFVNCVDPHTKAVLVTDLRMPHINGEHLVEHLCCVQSCFGIIVLTGHGEVNTAVKLLKNGVVDFLQKPVDAEILNECIKTAWQCSLDSYRDWLNLQIYHDLNAKEKKIYSLMVGGSSNKDMAKEVNLSVRSIEVYRANIMEKFSCNHLTHLVRINDQIQERYKIFDF